MRVLTWVLNQPYSCPNQRKFGYTKRPRVCTHRERPCEGTARRLSFARQKEKTQRNNTSQHLDLRLFSLQNSEKMSVVSTYSGVISYGSPRKLTHYTSEFSLLSRKGVWMVTLEFHLLYSWLLDSLLAKPAQPMTCRPRGMSSLFLLNLVLLCSSISHGQQHIHFHLNKLLGDSPSQLRSR